MRLMVFGSSSAGNGYCIGDNDGQIIIDAGVPVKEALKMLNYDIGNIEGVIISHEHKDHSGYIKQYEGYALKVWQPFVEEETKKLKLNEFSVQAFELPHDETENYGFYIKYKDERILYMTDLEYCPLSFAKVKPTMMMIECNYKEEYLDSSEMKFSHEVRGHASLETCKGIVTENDNECLKQIVLIHPSKSALDRNEALAEVKKITDKKVCFAEKGMTIYF